MKPPKVEEVKLEIKDVISDLIDIGHGSVISKKQLIEDIKGKYSDLKKTHVETFVKECFEKARRPLDSKVRTILLIYLDSTLCEDRCC